MAKLIHASVMWHLNICNEYCGGLILRNIQKLQFSAEYYILVIVRAYLACFKTTTTGCQFVSQFKSKCWFVTFIVFYGTEPSPSSHVSLCANY